MRKKILAVIIISSIVILCGLIGGLTYYFLRSSQGFIIETYDSDNVFQGTTIFADMHDPANPRIVEVNMEGEIVWEYYLPEDLKEYINPGMDVEVLPNDNILFVCPLKGVYEIARNGTIVWFYLNSKVSHDADRLPNHNTLICWGGNDQKNDNQTIEVHPNGTIVWSWKAKDYFNIPPYDSIEKQGWTHANAVSRLPNGNTIINLRNFNLTVEVNIVGNIVSVVDWVNLGKDPHEPEILPNGNLLIALQGDIDYQAVEINRTTGQVVWKYGRENMIFTRDADRLPNGNTLLVAIVDQRSKIFEVTQQGDIVWELAWGKKNSPIPGWFYKAERII